MGKLTRKGKHIVKVEYHLYKNMISRPVIIWEECQSRIFEMHLKLRDLQLKTIMYTCRLLYQNLMVTANEISMIETEIKEIQTPS